MNFDGGWTTLVLRASARPASEFCDRKDDHDGLARLRIFAVVKIGFRVLSLKKRIRARTSWERALRHGAGGLFGAAPFMDLTPLYPSRNGRRSASMAHHRVRFDRVGRCVRRKARRHYSQLWFHRGSANFGESHPVRLLLLRLRVCSRPCLPDRRSVCLLACCQKIAPSCPLERFLLPAWLPSRLPMGGRLCHRESRQSGRRR